MSGQIPSSTSYPPPVVVTCADISKRGESGPPVGIIAPAAHLTTPYSDTQDLWRSGHRLGTATEFVDIVGKDGDSFKIIKEVAGYVQAMINGARADSITLLITSGFRTWDEQQDLLEQKQRGIIDVAVAQPGTSNHQSGIAVDFGVYASAGRPYEWMVKNAWKYGFIRTVSSERWHWEYWGNWEGQQKPSWANGWHVQKTMFGTVGRVHTCSDPITRVFWWDKYYPTFSIHTDSSVSGRSNSWIGIGNEHLPDKFDREDSGWDRV